MSTISSEDQTILDYHEGGVLAWSSVSTMISVMVHAALDRLRGCCFRSFDPLEPDLTPVRKRGARAENHAAVVPRLTHHTVEYDATVLHMKHLSRLFINDPIDEASHTIRAATVRRHFCAERHPAIPVVRIDRFQNRAVVLDSHHLPNLEVEGVSWGLGPQRNLSGMRWIG